MIGNILLLGLAVLVFAHGIILHKAIAKHMRHDDHRCSDKRRDVYRAAHGAMFLGVGYFLAELRWLFHNTAVTLGDSEDLLWTGVEGGLLIYVLWLCRLGLRFLREDWSKCKLNQE